jgi:alkanesulfonate monooxygenase SsuD/methylene tetrahydromethanopterin reductase-like flavin-dependent oxidoreductase (luciferase family)
MLSSGRVDFAAGRGYDRREYLPFKVSFEENLAIFEEGLEVVRRLWSSNGPVSHHGRHYQFDDVSITPQPMQRPIPAYVASFSQPSIKLAARLDCGLIVAPFAVAMTYGGLQQVAELYQQTCAKHGRAAGRLMCSYFIHFADTRAEEQAARARQIRYYRECAIAALPGDPKTAQPSYRYFIGMVERLRNVRPEDLTENSVLLGSPAEIADTLKKVEAAGFDEVILYFNVGLEPHARSKTKWRGSWPRSRRPLPTAEEERFSAPKVASRSESDRAALFQIGAAGSAAALQFPAMGPLPAPPLHPPYHRSGKSGRGHRVSDRLHGIVT